MTVEFFKGFSAHHKLLPLLRRRKKTSIERRQLFATAEKVWSLSSARRECSSQNKKFYITHTHTQDDCYTLAANAYARVITVTTITVGVTAESAVTPTVIVALSAHHALSLAVIIDIITHGYETPPNRMSQCEFHRKYVL